MNFHTLKKFNKKTAGAKQLLSILITDANRKKLNAYLKNRLKERMRKRAFEDKAANLKDVVGSSMQHITPINQPLMLIVGLQLSGGDLLSQLFDGHPQLHVHPGEITLEIDKQMKPNGTRTDAINNPNQLFALLVQDSIEQHVAEMYRNLEMIGSSQPFVFIPYLQKRIFLRCLKSMDSREWRTVYNAYMTSYFGSWLNYANLTGHEKKYIVGRSKTLAVHRESVQQFFEVYPEGKLVSVIRDPKTWIRATSALEGKDYLNGQSAVNRWRESTIAMIRNKEVFGSRVCLVRYEDLIGDPEAVMRYLCEFLTIEFDNILLKPTFNRSGMKSRCYPATAEATRNNFLLHSDQPPFQEINLDWNQTLDEYEAVLGKTVQF